MEIIEFILVQVLVFILGGYIIYKLSNDSE
jgi:hypothetical protein